MPTFTLTPDLRLLNRYLTDSTEEAFDIENLNYEHQPIQIELDWSVFEDEAAFDDRFRKLLNERQLLKHYDNLLYIVLYVYDFVWKEIEIAYEQYDSLKRAKELAKLILLLKNTRLGKLSPISFKSFNDSAKTDDPILNDWISDTLIKALEAKQFPTSSFGTIVLEMLNNEGQPFDEEPVDLDKVKTYAKKRLINPKNRVKKASVTIASVVLIYLNNETELQSSDDTAFSKAQLDFLFDLLQLLKLVDESTIGSNNTDYMRTLLMNYLSQ